jgi:NAD(P)-dependent dehydrogenase (short-subunit alcohol dehydrogenase family)
MKRSTFSWWVLGAGVALLAAARMRRPFDFRAKTVVITGGSRGLGLELARLFAAEGARLAICARDKAELDRAALELRPQATGFLGTVCDVSVKADVQDFIHSVEERWGPVDVLINNAGIIQVGPIEAMTVKDFEEAMRTNYWGPLYAILAALPGMRARGEGRIVNIASFGGKVSFPHLLPYSASKFALVGLSEGMHSELRKDGIYVTTVCPGVMRTGGAVNAFFKGKHREEYRWFALLSGFPGFSINARRAARQIVEACRRGDSGVMPGLPAKVGARLQGLMPETGASVLQWVARWLPEFGGIGMDQRRGHESRTPLSHSPLTALSDRAAQRNNELPT